MRRLLSDIPRQVVVAVGVLISSGALFLLLSHFLGGARDSAITRNEQLIGEIQQARTNIARADEDHSYIQDNLEKYEALIQSDRLVPHTRRAAVIELQRIARERGLTGLSYTFSAAPANSRLAVSMQPSTAAYRLSVENVELSVSAPLDGPIYGFISDITQAFPGAAVVEFVQLRRAPQITDGAIAALAEGRDSGLVNGQILFSWRTAQVQEQQAAGGGR